MSGFHRRSRPYQQAEQSWEDYIPDEPLPQEPIPGAEYVPTPATPQRCVPKTVSPAVAQHYRVTPPPVNHEQRGKDADGARAARDAQQRESRGQ